MSTNNDSTQHVQIAVADPTPLGLFGLAVVTMVASAQKLGIVEGVSWVLPWRNNFQCFRLFLVCSRYELDD